MELSIGKLPDKLKAATASAAKSVGVENPPVWQNTQEVATINLLNLPSLCLFLDHVAKIEGFKDSNQALKSTRLKNLPWWETSIWLPLLFDPRPEPTVDSLGSRSFLGSCPGLISELEDIQKKSDLDLGVTPPGYEEMRAAPEKTQRSGFTLHGDHRAAIQWVWKGLYDGAQLALRNSAPMIGFS
ncbi:hypothetical protein [Pedosphaera parvula]|uniref:Uncharacterized protein n=1 Tax=Pedosphaera parvula (strain Ellin514) TaxID=320771 RepID=B9XR34_PEDPL|nr:hypothetical protein [Pedosphaera parvula]EEF57730.1 hypothetical protein Cflav_PD0792 [Pedosphaera parvula Ellin514]